MSKRQPADPERAAKAILAAVESDTPPTHLVLGKQAHEMARKRNGASARELAGWEHTGLPMELHSQP